MMRRPSKSQTSSPVLFNSGRARRSIGTINSSRQRLRFLFVRGGLCACLICIFALLRREMKILNGTIGVRLKVTDAASRNGTDGSLYTATEANITKPSAPASLGTVTRAKKGDHYQVGSAAICCVAKDEEAYIDEFVDFYLALGFSHIFIYDNSDKFDLRQFGESKDSRVYVRHHPGIAQQMLSFKHCAQNMARNHTWIAFFDVDEFLILFQHDAINDFLMDHLQEGALAINWRVVGSSGLHSYRPMPVAKRFLYRVPDEAPINTHVKVIARVNDIDFSRPVESPHYIPLKVNKTQRDTNGVVFTGPFNDPPSFKLAALYHYNSKSYKEYVKKRMRGRATVGRLEGDVDRFIQDAVAGDILNGTVYDDVVWETMKRMVPRYKYFDEYFRHGS